MIKYITKPINKYTTNAKYVVYYNGDKMSYHETIKDAKLKCLEILKKHPGYVVSIFVVESRKDVGGFYKMALKETSTLHF